MDRFYVSSKPETRLLVFCIYPTYLFMYANDKYKIKNSILGWPFSRKRILQHSLLLIAFLLASLLVYAFYQSSLHVTIPAMVPFFSSVPHYTNAWTFRPAATMRHPQGTLYKAAFVTLVQGDDVDDFGSLLRTVRDLEDSFNHKHGYPYIIFSVDPLSTRAKELVASLTSGTVHFESLQKPYYGYGSDTQLGKAVKARHQLKQVDHGDSKTFRFDARFMAGTLYHHPAIKELDYYWRFQPGTQYPCPMFDDLDPFYYMWKHQKKVSFSLTVREPIQAAPSLFQTVNDYVNKHPEIQSSLSQKDSLWPLVASRKDGQYTQCEFSSSFQVWIGDMKIDPNHSYGLDCRSGFL